MDATSSVAYVFRKNKHHNKCFVFEYFGRLSSRSLQTVAQIVILVPKKARNLLLVTCLFLLVRLIISRASEAKDWIILSIPGSKTSHLSILPGVNIYLQLRSIYFIIQLEIISIYSVNKR